MKTIKSEFFSAFLFLCIMSEAFVSKGQKGFQSPDGESIIGKEITKYGNDGTKRLIITKKHVYRSFYDNGVNGQPGGWGGNAGEYEAPYDVKIIDCLFKDDVILLLSNGNIVSTDGLTNKLISSLPKNVNPSGVKLKDLVGDDLYAISTSSVAVSRDSGKTWSIDTTGMRLGFGQISSICVDTNQNVYLTASNGLFMQAAKGNTWTKLTSYPGSEPGLVYVDKKLRVFVYDQNNYKFYESTDGGRTFASFNNGNYGFGYPLVSHIGEDNAGNIYVVAGPFQGGSSGSAMYRSMGGTNTFTEIDQPISALVANSPNPYIFNYIGGDSILYAGTALGLFTSRDNGTTWKNETAGITSDQNYSLLKTKNGGFVISTGLGVFYEKANDTIWNQTYPTSGNLPALPVFMDKSGDIYTYGVSTNPNTALYASSPKVVVKSTDNGLTWNPDTAGLSNIFMSSWFVDENGTQHSAGDNIKGVRLYSKVSGSSWQLDTSGLETTSNESQNTCWGTDNNGTVYLGASNNNETKNARTLWKKTGSGSWQIDTLGLKSATVLAIARESNGTMLAATSTGLYQNSGTGWQLVKEPQGSGDECLTVSVDASGGVWANFVNYDVSGDLTGVGVYVSSDNCKTWTSMNVTGSIFREIVPVGNGDTAYGVSYTDGIFVFNKSGASGIPWMSDPDNNNKTGLTLYPNPSKGILVVNIPTIFGNPIGASIEIIDMQGNIVSEMEYDPNSKIIDTRALPSGVYIAKYSAGNTVLTGRFVKE